jgi:hypothetical protein
MQGCGNRALRIVNTRAELTVSDRLTRILLGEWASRQADDEDKTPARGAKEFLLLMFVVCTSSCRPQGLKQPLHQIGPAPL